MFLASFWDPPPAKGKWRQNVQKYSAYTEILKQFFCIVITSHLSGLSGGYQLCRIQNLFCKLNCDFDAARPAHFSVSLKIWGHECILSRDILLNFETFIFFYIPLQNGSWKYMNELPGISWKRYPQLTVPSGIDRDSPLNECTLQVPFIWNQLYKIMYWDEVHFWKCNLPANDYEPQYLWVC